MQAAILAAGLGTRLSGSGAEVLKPLVEVNGKPLIGHVVSNLRDAGVQQIAMVLHTRAHAVEHYCRATFPRIDWRIAYRDTPHSWATLLALQKLLLPERFLLSTVDAVLRPGRFLAFAQSAVERPEPLILGVTDFVDDEKPLWVRWDATGRVTALGPQAAGSGWVTAGVYVMRPDLVREAQLRRSADFHSLREFLAYCVERGIGVAALPVGQAVDVDRPHDLIQAAHLLSGEAP